ncbi:hypothetical protein M422DRAFT_265808 [Sphaerobolus stellatus SS14]|uniref:Uncharacterized protein n=1 Tax=Sphaerobolus stellatus (strain SS14) TaxID=990650 RepID=A0A0C9UST9_SPHS4|nr:hypothetical protein M422DRAFT_265808 [Sphaerobolus stellatus SS14]
MPSRRIRISSTPPLPPFKIWFLVPEDVTSIRGIKKLICTNVAAVKEAKLRADQLVLEMDEFELPDDGSIELIRDTDILMLKSHTPLTKENLKRKVDLGLEPTDNSKQKKRKLLNLPKHNLPSLPKNLPSLPTHGLRISGFPMHNLPNLPSTPTSSSSSSSSSSSNSSDSSSDSDSDSDPSSSSSSSAPSEEPTRPIRPLVRATERTIFPTTTTAATAVTRTNEKARVQAPTIPPYQGKPSTQSRNKRRRIKRQYEKSKSEEAGEAGTFSQAGQTTQSGVEKAIPAIPVKRLENFVPPSQRDNIPSNIIVSSVEVEWKRTPRKSSEYYEPEQVEETEEQVDESIMTEQGDVAMDDGSLDWNTVEQKWDSYKIVTLPTELSSGVLVAWKGFGLDPVSLTPQIDVLHIATITSVESEIVHLELIARPDAGVSFGRAIIEDDGDQPKETMSISSTEASSSGWKILKYPEQ